MALRSRRVVIKISQSLLFGANVASSAFAADLPNREIGPAPTLAPSNSNEQPSRQPGGAAVVLPMWL